MPEFEDEIHYDVPFEMATDAMAIVDASSGDWRVRVINGAFADAFERSNPVVGEPLGSVLGFDPAERFGTHPQGSDDARVELGGDEHRVRVRAVDTSHAIVAVDPTPSGGKEAPSAESIRTLTAVGTADDAEAACAGVASLLRDAFGFDAVAISLDGVDHLAGVDDPIRPFDLSAATGVSIRHDVRDGDGETWGTVGRLPVGDRGGIQVATRAARTLDPDTVRGLAAVCRHLDRTLDGIERRRSLRAERAELATFNRILRHSVLNGLNLIRARLDLLEAGVSADDREHYETAYARVDDLLDQTAAIRELQSDGDAADPDAHSLVTLIDERLDRARELYPEASFSVDGPVPDVAVAVDELVHVCFRNVFRNAIQHANVDAPAVRVHVAVDADTAAVRIADNGSGLPGDSDQSVFDDGVSRLDGEGHGHGLFLTRKIVEDGYGGAVRAVESDRGGTEIVLEFPLAEPSSG